eukprot:6298801-Alexandrium_andersonii.AAC.1
MLEAVAAAGTFQARLGKKNASGGPAADEAELAAVHEELDNKVNKWNAFADKGGQQGRFIRAADYADQWFEAEDLSLIHI